MDYTTGEAVRRFDTAQPLPNTTDEARDAIERTRGRISDTLGAIEGRLVEKREELKARADVTRPLREQVAERPYRALGIALGAGILLGIVTGMGGEEREERRTEKGLHIPDEDERREIRARRAARKLRMRERFPELGEGRARRGAGRRGGMATRLMNQLRSNAMHQLSGALTGILTSAITQRMSTRSTRGRSAQPTVPWQTGPELSGTLSTRRDTGFQA